MSENKCNKCNKIFNTKYNLDRHLNSKINCQKKEKINFMCPKCDKTFARKTYLNNHISSNCDEKNEWNYFKEKNVESVEGYIGKNPSSSKTNKDEILCNQKITRNIIKTKNVEDLYDNISNDSSRTIYNNHVNFTDIESPEINKYENVECFDDNINNDLSKSNYNDHINLSSLESSEINKYDNAEVFCNNTSNNSSSLNKFNNTTEFPSKMIKYKENICCHCEKKFSRVDALQRHINNHCKKKKLEDEQVILRELINEMECKIQQNNNTLNNINSHNNTQIINNNLNLVAFGKENLNEIISEEMCKKILFKGFEAVPGLVEYVHFNKDMPQNHNCYISNLRGKYATIYDGSNWILKNTGDVIDILKENKGDFLETKFDEFYDSLCENTKKKFGRYIQESNTEVIKIRYRESLELLLYNNKNVIMNTKKNIAYNQKNNGNNLLKH